MYCITPIFPLIFLFHYNYRTGRLLLYFHPIFLLSYAVYHTVLSCWQYVICCISCCPWLLAIRQMLYIILSFFVGNTSYAVYHTVLSCWQYVICCISCCPWLLAIRHMLYIILSFLVGNTSFDVYHTVLSRWQYVICCISCCPFLLAIRHMLYMQYC